MASSNRRLCATLVGGAVLLGGHAQAQDQRAQGVTAYTPQMYEQVALSNALEMVQRLPGFTIVEVDSDVRGFGGARGNVLIDGAHPASKQDSLADLLRRIPIRAIERIELLRGAPGVDMAGHAVIANVVRIDGGGAQTAFEVGVGANGRSDLLGRLMLNHTRPFGAHEFELSATAERDPDILGRRGSVTRRAPGGDVLTWNLIDQERYEDEAALNLRWTGPLAGGRLTASGAVRSEHEFRDERRWGGTLPSSRTTGEDDYVETELAGRFNRAFGSTAMETLVSHREGRLEAVSERLSGGASEQFMEAVDSRETIGRIDLNRPWSDRLSLSAALEGAYNRMEGAAELVVDGTPEPLPGSDVVIEEVRAELTTGLTWRATSRLNVEGGLRAETSTIDQSGDSSLERSFVYLKPNLTATWRPTQGDEFRVALSREVGQLDFEDFLAQASLNNNQVSAGNAELEPDKTWRLALSWERAFWEDGAVRLTYTHERVEDVMDRVMVTSDDDVFDAPGNIGRGQRDILELEVGVSLDRLGMAGGRLFAQGLWRATEVTDPTTGQARRISDERSSEASIELSQALPAPSISWGVSWEYEGPRIEYVFDEIIDRRDGSEWTVYIERRVAGPWLLRAEINTMWGQEAVHSRSRADGPRSVFPIREIEDRRNVRPGRFMIILRRDAF